MSDSIGMLWQLKKLGYLSVSPLECFWLNYYLYDLLHLYISIYRQNE